MYVPTQIASAVLYVIHSCRYIKNILSVQSHYRLGTCPGIFSKDFLSFLEITNTSKAYLKVKIVNKQITDFEKNKK